MSLMVLDTERGCPSGRVPERYLPSADELRQIVEQRGSICLQELCAVVWPDLPWRPQAIGDQGSAADTPRTCWPGGDLKTAARWLRDQMRELLEQGKVELGPFRRDRTGLAGYCYLPSLTGGIV